MRLELHLVEATGVLKLQSILQFILAILKHDVALQLHLIQLFLGFDRNLLFLSRDLTSELWDLLHGLCLKKWGLLVEFQDILSLISHESETDQESLTSIKGAHELDEEVADRLRHHPVTSCHTEDASDNEDQYNLDE